MANPYTPPTAKVQDVGEETQPVKIWSASGRIGRVRLLAYNMAATFLVYAALALAFGIGAGVNIVLGVVIGVVAVIVAVVFNVLVVVQRSHDANWSGWMTLIYLFVPFAFLVWFFVPGTKGENNYGAPPPPNSTGVLVLAWSALALPVVLGILAAISIPAYMDYMQKQQAGEMGMQSELEFSDDDLLADEELSDEEFSDEEASDEEATDEEAADQEAADAAPAPTQPAE